MITELPHQPKSEHTTNSPDLKRGIRLCHDSQRIPGELTRLSQWVCWRYGELRPNGKCSKDPVNPRTGRLAKVNNPATWATFNEAVAAVESYGLEGVGFVFKKDDPFAGVDLDGCITDGEIEPWALNIVQKLGSYAEISPSGTGIKIIVRGSLPTDKTGVRRGPVELYQHGRFFTITGEELEPGKPVRDAQEPLAALYHRVEAKRPTNNTARPTQSHTDAAVGFSGDDERLLEKAARKQLFRALYYSGDWSGFKSASEADLYLCSRLAFWTGGSPERIDRLFRGSALMRQKSNREGYLRGTIEKAIEGRNGDFYTGESKVEEREDVRGRFEAEREAIDRLPFDWRGGDTDYKLSHALADTGCVSGSISGDHPTVAMAVRDMLTGAGIGSKDTVRNALARLIERGLIEVAEPGGKRTAATYRLRFAEASPPSPKVVHNRDHTHCVSYGTGLATVRTDVTRTRAPYTPPRKSYDKNGRPAPRYTGYLEKNMPTRCWQADGFIRQHSGASLEEIASHLGMNTRDGRYKVKNRYLSPLIGRGFTEERDGAYHPADGHEERFLQHLEDAGCNVAEQRQRDRNERERLAWELHGVGERIIHEYGQPGFDPTEPIPEPEEPPHPENEADTHTMLDTGPRESLTVDAEKASRGTVPDESWRSHPLDCECATCLSPMVSYANPRPLMERNPSVKAY